MTDVKTDEEWKRWVSWLGEDPRGPSIFEDVTALMASRQIWDGFRIVYDETPQAAKEEGTFQSWLVQNYVHRQGLAIRRQVDTRKDVVSVGRLLDRVGKHPEVLSRQRYAARVRWNSREEANRDFDHLVGAGRDHIDPAVPVKDLADLKAGTQRVVTWAKKEIAHYDPQKGQFGVGLTFGDLDQAIDLVIDTAIKYRRLILGSDMTRVVSMYAWESVFRIPWIPDDEHWNRVQREIREVTERRRGA